MEPGSWLATTQVDGLQRSVPVDLLVPEVLTDCRTGSCPRRPTAFT
ncbi:hypothetical protein [Actinoplanes sp. NPDC049118]